MQRPRAARLRHLGGQKGASPAAPRNFSAWTSARAGPSSAIATSRLTTPAGAAAGPDQGSARSHGSHSGAPPEDSRQAQQRDGRSSAGRPTAPAFRGRRARGAASLRRSPRVTATPSWMPGLRLGEAAVDASWTFAPGPILIALILGGLYVPRWLRVRRDDGAAAAPIWRLIVFLLGIVLLLVALVSPIDALAEQAFAMHMTQHVLLLDLVPICLMLGLTKILLRPATRRLQRAREGRRAARPPCLRGLLYVGAMWFWHVPRLYDAALEHDSVHVLEHVMFLQRRAALLVAPALADPLADADGDHGPGRLHAVDEVRRRAARDRADVRPGPALRLLRAARPDLGHDRRAATRSSRARSWRSSSRS